jgi:hypothetical protein
MKTPLALLLFIGLAPVACSQAPLPALGKLTSFDPEMVQVERRDEQWVIVAGELLLKECGKREQEAYQVASLIHQLGLNQHGVIGTKETIMEYWLINGQAPTALPRGVRVLPINLEELRLEQSQGFWVLRENARVLFNFGREDEQARLAMMVLKTYSFNRVGIVGQGMPLMMLFIAHPEGSGSRPVNKLHTPTKEKDKLPVPTVSSPPLKAASFYPTPIVPAMLANQQPGTLLDRGRPSRLAQASTAQAVPEAAVLGASMTRATFDYRQTQVRRENDCWVLASGAQTLVRFGTSERHARLAYAVMQNYRLTEMHQIGAPDSGVYYFLSSGQAPRGLMVGVMGDNFQPEQLSVRQVGEKFVVTQHGRILLDCGAREEDARELLQAIRRYGFDHVCHIGPSEREGMTLLVRSY